MLRELISNIGFLGLGVYSFGFSLILATSKVQTLNGYVTFAWDNYFPFEVTFFSLLGVFLVGIAIYGFIRMLQSKSNLQVL